MTLCLENAESAKKYIEACALMKKRRLADMQKAADIFSAIPDYKDATDKYEQTNLIMKKIRKTKKILSDNIFIKFYIHHSQRCRIHINQFIISYQENRIFGRYDKRIYNILQTHIQILPIAVFIQTLGRYIFVMFFCF